MGSLTQGAAGLSQSSNIAVDLDVVIFADGLVAGPDRYQTVAKIQARRQAAQQLSTTVLNMLQKGLDPSAMLSKAAARPPVGPNLVATFTSQVARLLRQGDLKATRATATTLTNLPNLTFHRQ
jgi:N-acetylglucosamine kinase-like BadF-type ATPase